MKKYKAFVLFFTILTILTAFLVEAPEVSAYNVIEGYIKDINVSESFIELEEYTGHIKKWSVTPNTILLIDNIPADPRDFKAGMEIYAESRGDLLSKIESWSTENPGYIPLGSKVRSGLIEKIDRDQLILRNIAGKQERYFTSPVTIALKNGKNVPLSTLYEGDMVRFYFDEKDSQIISRISILGDSIKIKGLYRGVLSTQNQMNNTLLLKNVAVFQNGDWQSLKNILNIDYSKELPVFYGGQPLPHENLQYFNGKTAYLAVKDFFGGDLVEKIVIKSQYETTFSDKIEEINWYSQAFELKNKRNIDFSDGTIFIKNQRLVDGYSMAPGQDALVVADGGGNRAFASIVHIYNQGINNSNIGQAHLYSGKLDMVVENRVVLKDFFVLNRNDWESFDDDKTLFYDNDTYIFDLEDMKQITPIEFFTEHYAVDERSSYARRHGLKSWHSYAYTEGDRIVAIVLQKHMDSLLRQRVTTGIIDRVDEDELVGKTVVLRDAKDWSSRNEKWMIKTIPVRIRVEEAMLLKGNNIITLDELKPGDSIYSVRDDFEGKFLLVK